MHQIVIKFLSRVKILPWINEANLLQYSKDDCIGHAFSTTLKSSGTVNYKNPNNFLN